MYSGREEYGRRDPNFFNGKDKWDTFNKSLRREKFNWQVTPCGWYDVKRG